MKARMTSLVTVMPRLESGDDRPVKGLRNGTRARAVAKCPASNETSRATIGARAVATSGRFPIATGVTFAAARAQRQLPAAGAAPAPPDRLEFRARVPRQAVVSHMTRVAERKRRGTVRPATHAYSCTAREGKPVGIRRWSATVNGAPSRRHHEPGYLKARKSSHRRDTRTGAR